MAESIIRDDFFGALSCYDDLPPRYITMMEFADGQMVGVSIWMEGIEREAALAEARRCYPEIQCRERDYRCSAALELVSKWSAYAAVALNPVTIQDSIFIQSIDFLPDGRIELWYDQGGLFPGYRIVVTLDLALAFQAVALAES